MTTLVVKRKSKTWWMFASLTLVIAMAAVFSSSSNALEQVAGRPKLSPPKLSAHASKRTLPRGKRHGITNDTALYQELSEITVPKSKPNVHKALLALIEKEDRYISDESRHSGAFTARARREDRMSRLTGPVDRILKRPDVRLRKKARN